MDANVLSSKGKVISLLNDQIFPNRVFPLPRSERKSKSRSKHFLSPKILAACEMGGRAARWEQCGMLSEHWRTGNAPDFRHGSEGELHP